MGAKTQAVRIAGFSELDDAQMMYWFDAEHGFWYLYLPGCGLGNLANHQVTENADGTITVRPSILVTGHDNGQRTQRHGYLTAGVWEEC